jgi:hypothetical protein
VSEVECVQRTARLGSHQRTLQMLLDWFANNPYGRGDEVVVFAGSYAVAQRYIADLRHSIPDHSFSGLWFSSNGRKVRFEVVK